jgi:hypothetical protein
MGVPQQPPLNAGLADQLSQVASILAQQGADPFRVSAYQNAADTIRDWPDPVWQVYEKDGIEGLQRIPDVGRTISKALQQLIRGGRWPLLERLLGNDVVESAFATIPSIGPRLARRIHEELEIETLAELQAAAWDGRLAKLPGFGEKRLRAVRESLHARGRVAPDPDVVDARRSTDDASHKDDLTRKIAVSELLDVDREYREKAQAGKLFRVAPRRFNPNAEAWLPILHTRRNDHHYTALFSNTEHAHAMGTTEDWVVIYIEDHLQPGTSTTNSHGKWTVITSLFGDLSGKRIVRGRENECREYYNRQPSPGS